jgi:hypothetical protein
MANEENLKPFKKGEDPRRNMNGRPRKSFSTINAGLKAKGVEKLSKTDLLEAYALIFNSSEQDLVEIAKDKETPYAFKIIITELNDKRTRAKAMQDYRDYTFGRAVENIEVNNAVTIFELPANGRESKDEENK